jgi:ketosteroid isomerase-like protein
MTVADEHPNARTLRAIYADLTRLGEYTSEDVVLHPADRGAPVVGRERAVAKERDLIRLTGGTLVMDVERIVANDQFGAVLGVLRAHRDGQSLAVPFCGLWRFREGRVTEHWENAYDLSALDAFLAGGPPT